MFWVWGWKQHFFCFLQTKKVCNESFKSNHALSTELFQAVSESARLPQAILHLILLMIQKDFSCINNFGCDLAWGFFCVLL